MSNSNLRSDELRASLVLAWSVFRPDRYRSSGIRTSPRRRPCPLPSGLVNEQGMVLGKTENLNWRAALGAVTGMVRTSGTKSPDRDPVLQGRSSYTGPRLSAAPCVGRRQAVLTLREIHFYHVYGTKYPYMGLRPGLRHGGHAAQGD